MQMRPWISINIFNSQKQKYNIEKEGHNNPQISEDKLIALCEKRYKCECLEGRNDILVIGNIVDSDVKKAIEDKYKIIIWDVICLCQSNNEY